LEEDFDFQILSKVSHRNFNNLFLDLFFLKSIFKFQIFKFERKYNFKNFQSRSIAGHKVAGRI